MSLQGMKVLIVEADARRTSAWTRALQGLGAEVEHRAEAGKGLEAMLLGAVAPRCHELVLIGPSVSASMADAFRHSLVGSLASCRVARVAAGGTDSEEPSVDATGASISENAPRAGLRVALVALGQPDPGCGDGPSSPDGSEPPPPEPTQWTILVVEDNPVSQQVAVSALSLAGMQICTADNGQEALDALVRGRFDAIVMDIQMPVMDGLTATRHIRSLPPPVGHIPVVALTGNALPSYRQDAAAAGMNGFVEKPVRGPVLVDAIQRAIEGRPILSAVDRFDFQPETTLDLTVLNDLKEAFGPALSRVQATLARDAPQRMERMQSAIQTGDFELIRRESHSLKSSSATFGLSRVSRLSKQIEMACIESRQADAAVGITELGAVLDTDLAELAANMG